MTDVTAIAASGMQTAMRSMESFAADIANAAVPPPAANSAVYQPTTIVQGMIPASDMATAIVGTLQAANSFRANLAVFRTGSRMFKALIDTVA